MPAVKDMFVSEELLRVLGHYSLAKRKLEDELRDGNNIGELLKLCNELAGKIKTLAEDEEGEDAPQIRGLIKSMLTIDKKFLLIIPRREKAATA